MSGTAGGRVAKGTQVKLRVWLALKASLDSTVGVVFDPRAETTGKAAYARISKTPWRPLNVLCIRREGRDSGH